MNGENNGEAGCLFGIFFSFPSHSLASFHHFLVLFPTQLYPSTKRSEVIIYDNFSCLLINNGTKSWTTSSSLPSQQLAGKRVGKNY